MDEGRMKLPSKDKANHTDAGSAREMRQELRSMGIRLTGHESRDELQAMLKEELNRQWFRSAARGNVIRRPRNLQKK
jgi:hypothetical protein